MAGSIRGLTVVINGDTSGFNAAIRNAKSQARTLKSEIQAINGLLKFKPTSTDLLVSRQIAYGNALRRSADEITNLRSNYQRYQNMVGPMTQTQLRQMAEMRTRIRECELEYANLRREMVQMGALAPVGLQKAAGAATHLGDRLRTVSNCAVAGAAAVAYLGYQCAKAAIDFEYAFADVRKTIVATETDYDRLYSKLLDMSLNRPSSAKDLAYITSLGGQLNIAYENLSKFAGVIADLDVATDMDLETASLQLAQFMNITNTAQGDVDRLGATIVDLGNNSATTESSIMNMAMRIAGSGSNIGLTAAQVLALATALSSVGIQAEMGGNAISTIMNRIDKDVALGSETLAVWAETAGMSADEFKAKWGTDVMGALLDVIYGMGTFKDEGNNLNLLLKDMGISYMRQVDTMQRLARTGDLVSAAVTRAGVAWKQNSALTREVTQRYQTAESQISMTKNAISKAAITMGNELLPYVKDAAGGVADLANRFAELDDRDKRMIVSAAALAVQLGVALKLFQGGAVVVGNFLGVVNKLWTLSRLVAVEKAAETAAETANTAAKVANTAATAAGTAANGLYAASAVAAKVAMGGLVALLAGAAIAAIAAFVGSMNEARGIEDEFTAETKDLERAVDESRAAYERACEAYGETSNEALKAKGALEQAQRAFEDGKETVGDYTASLSDFNQAYADSAAAMDDAAGSAEQQAASWLYLADQINVAMDALAAGDEKSARMVSLCDALNESMGETVVAYDAAADSIGMTADALDGLVDAASRQARSKAAMDGFNESVANQIGLEAELADAERNLRAAQEGLADATERTVVAGKFLVTTNDESKQAVSELSAEVERLRGNIADAKNRQADYLETMQRLRSEEEAVARAIEVHRSEGVSLAQAVERVNGLMGTSIDVGMAEAQMRLDSAAAEQAQAEAAEELGKELAKLMEELTGFAMASRDFSRFIADGGYSLEAVAKKMQAAGIEVSALKEDVENFSSSASAALEEWERNTETTFADYKKNLQSHVAAMREWNQNVSKAWQWAAEDPAKRAWIQEMAADKETYIDLMASMAKGGSDAFDEMWGVQRQLNEENYRAMSSYLEQVYGDVFTSMEDFTAGLGASLGEGGRESAQAFVDGLSQLGLSSEEILSYTADLTAGQLVALAGAFRNGGITSKAEFLNAISGIQSGTYEEVSGAAGKIDEASARVDFAAQSAGAAGGARLVDAFGNALSPLQRIAENGGASAGAAFESGATSKADNAVANSINAYAAAMGRSIPLVEAQGRAVGAAAGAAMGKDTAAAKAAGKALDSALSTGLSAGRSVPVGKAASVARAAGAAFRDSSAYSSAKSAGSWMAKGLAVGIDASSYVAIGAASRMAKAAVAAAKKAAEVSSPSRAMERVGVWFGPGLAVGIDKSADSAVRAARNLSEAAVRAASLSELAGGIGGVRGASIALSSAAPTAGAGPVYETVNNYYSVGDVSVSAKDLEGIKTVEELFGLLKRSKGR